LKSVIDALARRDNHVRRVVFHPRARRDLEELYDYIAEQGSPRQGGAFIDRIKTYCLDFSTFPERGMRRDDIAPGIRVVGFRRRVSITFSVTDREVWILGIYYGGRNFGPPSLDEPDDP
jgi:toxin ParE1/3/4